MAGSSNVLRTLQPMVPPESRIGAAEPTSVSGRAMAKRAFVECEGGVPTPMPVVISEPSSAADKATAATAASEGDWDPLSTRLAILDSVAQIRAELSALVRSQEYAFQMIPFLLGIEYATGTGLPTRVRMPLVCVGIVSGFLGKNHTPSSCGMQWDARAIFADEQHAQVIVLSELLGQAEKFAYRRDFLLHRIPTSTCNSHSTRDRYAHVGVDDTCTQPHTRTHSCAQVQ